LEVAVEVKIKRQIEIMNLLKVNEKKIKEDNETIDRIEREIEEKQQQLEE
jgi:hypothetical protein